MSKLSKKTSKTINVLSIVLELICEIVLLPFHILKAICEIINELNQ